MGVASFSVFDAVNAANGAMQSSTVFTSGAHTTSTTASNIEDATADIDLSVGQCIQIHADEAMRVSFGGIAATASTGHYIPEGGQREFKIMQAGTVSIIDVA